MKNMVGQDLENDQGLPIVVGVLISNVLAGKTSNPQRAWVLGRKFASKKVVDLLAEDVVFIKQEILNLGMQQNSWLSGLLTGQLIEVLDGGPTENIVVEVEPRAKTTAQKNAAKKVSKKVVETKKKK